MRIFSLAAVAVVLVARTVGTWVAALETAAATAAEAAVTAATGPQHYVHERVNYQTTALDPAPD